MVALQFLNKILPSRGIRFLTRWVPIEGHKRGGILVHRPFGEDDNDQMAEAALAASAKGANIYFACASYKEVIYKTSPTGKEYIAGREQTNVRQIKAFWLDIDVGKADPDKCYATQEEAIAALDRLVAEAGLPAPMVVNSGAGIHVYWPLTKEIEQDLWKRTAVMLQAICDHLGIKVDPSRTKDEASVLRVPGTLNPKHGAAVTVLRDIEAMTPGTFVAPVAAFVNAKSLKAAVPRAPGVSRNAALIGTVEHPPSYADILVTHCAAVKHFRDMGGSVVEPYWYTMVGLLKHTVESDAVVHAWSSAYPGYDEADCQAKIDQWGYGPPSCEVIRGAGGACGDCKHTCKSPIQLGHTISPATVTLEDALDVVAEEPSIPFCPTGFRWTGNVLVQEVADKDGVINDVVFSDTLFYAVDRVRVDDGTWNLRMRMHIAGGKRRDFDLPQMLIPDPRGLARHLAQYEIILFNMRPAMDYMKGVSLLLRQHLVETVEYDRFGWDGDDFIVGTTAFEPSGSTKEVLVSKSIQNIRKNRSCAPKGDLETWSRLVDTAYNRPGAEMYQFIFCSYGFGSPLVSLADFSNYSGIPVVITGESGAGKSSVFLAANTIYAEPSTLKFDASSKGGATLQALMTLVSMYNGVPLLLDELTERDDKDFTPIFYNLANGMGKVRLTTSGKFAESARPFAGICGGTSNKSITDKIQQAETRDVSDAASARCFEIQIDKQAESAKFAGTDMKSLLEHHLFKTHGVAAQAYLPYVMQNRATIVKALEDTRIKLGRDVSADSRERYYVDTIAFAFVAGTIAKKLGLIHWDVKAMTQWAIQHMYKLRAFVEDHSSTVDDDFGALLSWIQGRCIITKRFPTQRTSPAESEFLTESLKGVPVGRIALVDKRLFITHSALREFCLEYKIHHAKVIDQFRKAGVITDDRREYLGRGTSVHIGRARCYEFNFSRAAGQLHAVLPSAPAEDEQEAGVTCDVT